MAHVILVVEDGSIVANANSYVTEAEFIAYADERLITLTAHPEVELIKAMDYLETIDFIGVKKTRDQPLQWPRDNVTIDGFSYQSTEIPVTLKNAQLAIAMSIAKGIDPLGVINRAVKREKVDVIEVEYMDSAASADMSRAISASIRKLIVNSASGLNFRINHG
ncbi:MAG: hypothetical protein RQ783_08530 [Gammaproteobacteria bacterium]|nr:hypothetical protein [Gammaproteobacteria bacterium]